MTWQIDAVDVIPRIVQLGSRVIENSGVATKAVNAENRPAAAADRL
jgi:hypothetical protein